MDRKDFLARVIPSGNFNAVCFKGAGQSHMGQRFFLRSDLAQADGFIGWCVKQKMDVWHAVAAYRDAQQNGVDQRGNPKYKGKREQANVELLGALWHDADISRPGDGKAPGKTWADLAEVVTWINDLFHKTGLLVPNLWVRSGYGVHLYWSLATPLDQLSWQPYAEALKNLLVANGGRGDMGLTADSARILRPPGTLNFKVPASPQPVEVIDAWTTQPYPNQAFFKALQPYVGKAPSVGLVTNTGSALPSGNLPTGGPAGAYQGRSSTATAAGQAVPPRAQRAGYNAETIYANGCLQLRKSRDEHGALDAYDLWYLGWMSLAAHLDDRNDFVHEVSDAHPKYTRANVDAHLAQAEGEHQKKRVGPPLCATLNAARTGVCTSCPHWGHITTPWTLGVPDFDLPSEYRRHDNQIQRRIPAKGEWEWSRLVLGDVSSAFLDAEYPSGREHLTFTYQFDAQHDPVRVTLATANLPNDQSGLGFFMEHGINLRDYQGVAQFRKFIMAWIDKLRATTHVQTYIKPFGWTRDKVGKYIGFAICDTLYRVDGSQAPVNVVDQNTRGQYRPEGSLELWTAACNFVIKGRPELQILVAAAFAAPLLELTGSDTKGLAFSLWSQRSATGKSSAISAGATVWGSNTTSHRLTDTINAFTFLMAQTQSLPNYWDEVPPSDEAMEKIVETLFMLGPGRNKRRAAYGPGGMRVPDPGEWSTIMCVANNRPLMEQVVKDYGHTEAAALRLFEICSDLPQPIPVVAGADAIVGGLERNRGNAGRVYAAALARNIEIVRQDLVDLRNLVDIDFEIKSTERFYATFITCILLGADYAERLGLAAFEYDAIYDLLKREIKKMRIARGEDIAAVRNMNDPIGVISKFFDDNRSTLVVVDSFPTSLNPRHKSQLIYSPEDDQNFKIIVPVHAIAYQTRILRIAKAALSEFCRKNKMVFEAVRKQLVENLGAQKRERAPIASGTPYQASKQDCIDIPLDADPELEQFLDVIPPEKLTAYLKLQHRPTKP